MIESMVIDHDGNTYKQKDSYLISRLSGENSTGTRNLRFILLYMQMDMWFYLMWLYCPELQHCGILQSDCGIIQNEIAT